MFLRRDGALRRKGSVLETDERIQEGIFHATEQSIDGVDQARIGTPITEQGRALCTRVLAGLAVGEDVAAAESVDGLFGIALEQSAVAGGA